jgi:ABC-type multidrug transport system ATPase subunit/pSer/pThr/pTyr-binding forkhead associated (FHA) protein
MRRDPASNERTAGPPVVVQVVREGESEEFALPAEGATIGRSSDNHIALNDPLVSRRHARLDRRGTGVYLTDLGSANGTRLNGVPVDPDVPVAVQGGDEVGISSFVLRLLPDGGEATASRPPPAAGAAFDLAGASAGAPAPAPGPTPVLVVTTPDWSGQFPLAGGELVLGRDPECDIRVEHEAVSRRHALLRRVNGGYEIDDLRSTNGLFFDGNRIEHRRLSDGDVLAITSDVSLRYMGRAATSPAPPRAVPSADRAGAGRAPRAAPPRAAASGARRIDLAGLTELRIGRDAQNDLTLDHPTVSRFHARLTRAPDGRVWVEDLGSTNGTFVSGTGLRQGERRQLDVGDIVHVGPAQLEFTGTTLVPADVGRGLQLDVFHLNKIVSKELNLLHDISFSIHPHEFVAIVGVSGAGKSTLLDALNGFRPATQGAVLINGSDLYRNLDAYRTELGYVPQEDIIHKELSPYQALDYAARLRLPADTGAHERRERVLEVLETLGIRERKDVPIHRLSGGQRKRVSIGVELLTRPGLFYLDEATSGLDPGTESQMMRLLRDLADRGHTVVLITHATKNVMLCDHVVFLAKGGRLAYYGPPDESLQYFETEDFDDIYLKLEEQRSPDEWAERYRASPQFRRFVVDRLQEASAKVAATPKDTPSAGLAPGAKVRRVSSLRQLFTLSQRNIAILARDRVALSLMLMIAPMIGLLDLITWKRSVFAEVGGQPEQATTFLFLAALICVLVGAIASMREIVKEVDVYRRERMVTLRIGPYVLSKVWVGVLLALYQAVVFVVTKKLAAGWPHSSAGLGQEYVTLFLATLSGMLLGLLISAIAPNQNVAPLLLIVFLVPQFMFGGPLLALNTGAAGDIIAAATSTKWSYQALEVVGGYLDVGLSSRWLNLLIIILVTLGLILLAQRAKDGGGTKLKERISGLFGGGGGGP